jgi:hypothetical protein
VVFALNVDREQESSVPASPIPKRDHHWVWRLARAVLGTLLLVILVFFTLTSAPTPKVVWLTQAEMAHLKHRGPLTRLKDKFMNLTVPLWRHYWNTRPQVLIDSTLLTLPDEIVERINLGTPVATNADGLHAWIVSPAELNALKNRLQTMRGPWLIGKPRIQTASGVRGVWFAGRILAVASNSTPVGVSLDVNPQVVSDSISLSMEVTATEALATQSATHDAIKTNLAVACRALLPDAGGLVLDSGNTKDSAGKRFWLIISPTILRVGRRPERR